MSAVEVMKAAREMREALQALHDDNMDYLTRNKLGGENNHCMKWARSAIASFDAALQPERRMGERRVAKDNKWRDECWSVLRSGNDRRQK